MVGLRVEWRVFYNHLHQKRMCWFGEISKIVNTHSKNCVSLSAMGHIANSCWYDIPNHFPFVELGAHIIMPNHMHGILIINKPNDDHNTVVQTQNIASPQQQQPPKQSTDHTTASKSKTENDQPKNQFGPQSQNLASIIRGFKIGVTKNSREINQEFAWQSRYHDHIIRDEKSYHNISKYIINNPLKWQEDKFYKT